MIENDFQKVYDDLNERTGRKVAELHQVENELTGVIARLVDAPQKERAAIIAKRAELVNLAGVLRDELAELNRRKNAAYLAIFEQAEAQALAEVERLAVIARDARKAMDAAADAHRHYINRGGRNPQTAEDARALAVIVSEQTRTAAESQIASRDLQRARDALTRTQHETAEVRAILGVPEMVSTAK